MNSVADVWAIVLQQLKKELSETTIAAFFDELEAVDIRGNTFILHCANDFKKGYIESLYLKNIKDSLHDIFSTDFEVKILDDLAFAEFNGGTVRKQSDRFTSDEFTFETFVVGPSNKLAYAASQAVAEHPAQNYNPLLIYGDSGLGKTHLIYAIANVIRRNDPRSKIAYVKGDDFTNELVDAIREAVARGKRVIIEHFDLVYEALGFNADLIVGIGEEVIVTRPNIFGPLPEDVAKVVHKSVHTRLMAHTAEDLCEFHMPEKEVMRCLHADIKSGFLMAFHDSPPEVDLEELEKAVLADIAADLPVEYVDDRTIRIGDAYQPCTGPRTHVSSTGKIVGFHLLKEIIYDHRNQRWLLVGRVGNVNVDEARHHFNDLGLV